MKPILCLYTYPVDVERGKKGDIGCQHESDQPDVMFHYQNLEIL